MSPWDRDPAEVEREMDALDRHLYERTGNPVVALEAARDNLRAGRLPPEWARGEVVALLDRLLALAETSHSDSDIVKATGLKLGKFTSWLVRYRLLLRAISERAGSDRTKDRDAAEVRRLFD
jgi:hypothetical protein